MFKLIGFALGLITLTTGCVTVDILCDNKIGSDNNLLTVRSVVVSESSADLSMQGSDSTTLDATVPILKNGIPVTEEPPKGDGKVRLLCNNELVSHNNIGAVRSLTAGESVVKQNMEGGDTNDVGVIVKTPVNP